MATKKFPKQIYVTIEQPVHDDPYMVVHEDQQAAIENAGNGGIVAVFDFNRTYVAEIINRLKTK